MRLHIGKLRRFLWDGDTGVISVERDDGSTVALLVHGAVVEDFMAKHAATESGATVVSVVGLRVICEESSRGVVTHLAVEASFDAGQRKGEEAP